MAATVVNSPTLCLSIVKKLAVKIKSEMKNISSADHDSILRDSVEAIKHFHWDTVFLELQNKVPTLMSLLKQIVKLPAEKKPLLCFLGSQLLKSRHQHMGLVQRAISVMLYGNGTAKQVCLLCKSLKKKDILLSLSVLGIWQSAAAERVYVISAN